MFLIAPFAEPWIAINWDVKWAVLLLASSILGVSIPYWAIAMAGRRLPAITVSQGLLGAPIIGVAVATIESRFFLRDFFVSSKANHAAILEYAFGKWCSRR
ncbi:MAG: hypothetical protein ACKVQU_06135 [Burkholderiales bacterium]